MAASTVRTCAMFGRSFSCVRGCFPRVLHQKCYNQTSQRSVVTVSSDEVRKTEPAHVNQPSEQLQRSRQRRYKRISQLNKTSQSSLMRRESEVVKAEDLQQPLLIMPFNIVSGGKFIIHLLQKYEPRRALILVRAKALARELCLELEENGFCCTNALPEKTEEQDTFSSADENITIVASDEDACTWDSFPKVDLLIQVQQPLSGSELSLKALKKSNFTSESGKAIMMYTQNDFPFISKLQQHVTVSKVSPPSFYTADAAVSSGSGTQGGVPAVIHREPVSELEAAIPEKIPQYAIFRPSVPVSSQVSERGRLCDHARLYVRGGSGGQGSMTYAGLGGDGGHVILECQEGASLQHFSLKENRRVIARHGTHYSSLKRKKKGARGLDLVVPVPPGTTVTTDDGKIIGEMEKVGTRLLIARGGRGGSPSTEDWGGEKGQIQMIRLDLKLTADVGLVGFPNAGKSTLLATVTRADSKAGDYPFTTIRPYIGMMDLPDASQSQISIADLPGLVEGAHLNRGMGHRFLKHVERTKILAIMVDVNGFQLSDDRPYRTAFASLCLLLKELVLYENRLTYQPKVLIVSKMDTEEAEEKCTELIDQLQQLRDRGGLLDALHTIPPDDKLQQVTNQHESAENLEYALSTRSIEFDDVIPVSVVAGQGVDRLRSRLKELVTRRQAFYS